MKTENPLEMLGARLMLAPGAVSPRECILEKVGLGVVI